MSYGPSFDTSALCKLLDMNENGLFTQTVLSEALLRVTSARSMFRRTLNRIERIQADIENTKKHLSLENTKKANNKETTSIVNIDQLRNIALDEAVMKFLDEKKTGHENRDTTTESSVALYEEALESLERKSLELTAKTLEALRLQAKLVAEDHIPRLDLGTSKVVKK